MTLNETKQFIVKLLKQWLPNKKTIDKISESAEGNLLFNGEEIKGAGNESSSASSTPVGTVISFMGKIAPFGYLICDGATYNITEYKELANFFNKQFGKINYFGGDGEITFKVPDLRGEFLRGTGTNSHGNQGSGANVGVHQNATEHIMIQSDAANTFMVKPTSITTITEENIDSSIGKSNTSRSDKILSGSTNTWTGNNLHYRYTSRPTNTSVLYCIKYTETEEGGSTSGGSSDIYSLDEVEIGTWIDGSKLYRRVVDMGNNFAVNTSSTIINIGMKNVNIIKAAFQIIRTDDGVAYSAYNPIILYGNNDSHRYRALDSFGAAANTYVKLVMEYTKVGE